MKNQICDAMTEFLKSPGYGIDIQNCNKDGSSFDLVLTFKSGCEYCCMEPGCHLPFGFGESSRQAWKKFREVLNTKGINPKNPLKIKMKGIVEERSVMVVKLRKTEGCQRFVTEKTHCYSDGIYQENF